MARKRGNSEEQDDPIKFENLDGSPDDEQYDDLTPPEEENTDWTPPEEGDVEPRNSSMVDEGDLKGEDEDEDEDDGEAEELQTAGEAEQEARGDVDEDLQDLPEEAQQKVMAERRKAREAAEQVQRYQKSVHDAEVERAKSQETAVQNELEKQRQAYRDAVEEGDTDKQLQANESIADLKYKLNQWADYRGKLEQQGPQQGQQAQQRQPKGTTEEANRWLSRNTWFQDPSYQEHAQFARVVDKNLVNEGWDPSSREYFDELERRMLRKYPDLPIKRATGEQAQSQQKRKPKRSPVGAPDKGQATPRQSRGNKVVLTQEDRQNMRRFGLDPDDKETVRMYAQEKRKNERRAGAGRS